MQQPQQTIVKTYRGKQQEATAEFQADARKMAAMGYVPANQTWAAGSYGCGAFIFALLLCFVLVGFLIFIYMLIVKPAGTLTVTYVLSAAAAAEPEKTCPQCAEKVKAAARICRFCGHTFPELPEPVPTTTSSAPVERQPSAGAYSLGRKAGQFFGGKKD
jgi:hypothetical protein